ncbi:retinoblastoma-binding protein-like protein 5 [Amylocarpus encephaloides]|uniref:Retinoblastoma-binding protein-like protein 5 n=1 Tax=Amylocarpus encephaloides TaxID=45428 RepID=A0A9P7YMT4_9HELO|nr:retinoblastoma-binding protein-like protein 5 [Amylocarpus encephaloides]
MNLALSDPFVLAQDYPESSTGSLRSGHACALRFNHKGDFLAAGRADGVVVIFDVETQGVACKLKGHTRQIQSLSWSRCGRYLLTSSQDWKCIVWDLQDASILQSVRFEAAVYIAELHPWNHLMFTVSLFEEQPILVDATELLTAKYNLSSAPKRDPEEKLTEKQAAADLKQTTTVSIFTATGEHIVAGTNKGWLNIIDVRTRTTIYSTKICAGVVIFLRLTSSGRDIVINSSDRIIRTIQLPNLKVDPDTIVIEVEHKFQDVVNKLSWNHVAFSSTGDYVTASTYNNHDIYIWERTHGSLVRILEGTKEEHGVVEWHPHRPMIVACGLESGRIHIWSIVPQQRWSALAPDFVEVEENVEYIEREDEFDIHPQEEIHKRRLDLEDDNVDVFTVEPIKDLDEENSFRMPVQLDLQDSEGEEEFVTIGRGEMRRKSPTAGREYMLDSEVIGSADEEPKKTGKKYRKR